MHKLMQFIKNIVIFHSINLFFELLPNHSISNALRGYFYGFFFKKCGKNFKVAKGVLINCKENMEVGNNVYIAHDSWINAAGGIVLGNNVIISPKVVIATTKHAYENGSVMLKNGGVAPVIINAGTWIASNVTITMGVIVGKGCIIAANSALSKDVDDYKMVGGVPAKFIKELI